jgi:DNA-binding transcriptional LysR family regulator
VLNPRQIEAFRAVMVTGGITAAARALHITQPAVSRLIADLQHALKLTLFERRGARFLPTSQALTLYREVERQFVGLDRITQAARDLRERRAGLLRIAAMPALAVGFLPRFAGAFLKARPALDLAIFGGLSSGVHDWIATGHCELGFAQTLMESASVAAEKLVSIPAVAIVPETHPLARRRTIRPRDFAGEPFIAMEATTPLRHRVDIAFADCGVSSRSRAETPLSMIACGLVASGAGVSIVDPLAAAEYAGHGLAIRPFLPRVPFDVVLLRSAQRPLSPLAEEFVEEFRTAIGGFAEPPTTRSAPVPRRRQTR